MQTLAAFASAGMALIGWRQLIGPKQWTALDSSRPCWPN
jgi:hypothetical protein